MKPSRSRLLRAGVIAGISSAALFALNLSFARLAYDYGTNVHALNLSRSLTLLVCLVLYCASSGIRLSADRATTARMILLGLLMTGQLFALVAALRYAPVGIVLIIFFSYPLLVTVGEQAVLRQYPRPALVVALLVAFAGLALVLGPGVEQLNTQGLILAATAALFFAFLVTLSSRTMQAVHPAKAMAWMMLVTCCVCAVTPAFSSPAWPDVRVGWYALTASALLFCVATVLFFAAIHLLGPMRAAILDNTAPVWGILWGFLLLGERFSTTALVGAAAVVIAVAAAQALASDNNSQASVRS